MFKPHIVHKERAHSKSPAILGNKGYTLGILSQQGIPVPDFFIITTFAYQKYHHTRLNPHFTKAIAQQLNNLTQNGRFNVAVRSSAPFEDQSGHSLAGQLESFLNLSRLSDVLEAIEKVWNSIDNNTVKHYLRMHGHAIDGLEIAVVVQKMIEPEFAGVAFTRDPVSGTDHTMLIEVVSGAGEQLVSGAMQPDTFHIDKSSRKVVRTSGAGTIDQHTFRSQCLGPLLDIIIKIEDLQKEPQDVEWAFKDGRVWIVQSRYITHIDEKTNLVAEQDGSVWTNYFFSERFNKKLSPLGWSFLDKWVTKNAFREPLWYLGNDILAKQKKLTQLIDGVPYTDLKVFHRLYAPIPEQYISLDKKRALHLNAMDNNWFSELVHSAPFIFDRLIFRDLNWFPFFNLRQWSSYVWYCDRELETLEKGNMVNHSTLQQLESLTDRFLSIHRWSITFADIFTTLLLKYLSYFFPDDYNRIGHNLLTGLEDNETVKANLALAQCVNKADLERFVRIYGHRAESLDIAEPTWAERKEHLLLLIKNNPHQLGKTADKHEQLRNTRIKTEHAVKMICKSRVLSPFFILAFKVLLYYSREFTLLRENQRNQWHKILFQIRRIMLHIGESLQKKSILDDKEQIFYLQRKTVYDILDGNILVNTDQIKRKQREYTKKSLEENTVTHLDNGGSPGMLRGIGVSRGIVSGTARITRSYPDAFKGRTGDILVAHAADPGWSPVFNVVSGLVLEAGGVLSHASIVAREFGLPAVTSVTNAMQLIHDGDLLQINGEEGTIEILKQHSSKSYDD